MVTSISHSPAETEALGESWGGTIEMGLVLALCGDLGAGKTQLVKGLARGLGSTARVHSPTFALVNIYSGGRLLLFHLDLYRLETPDQIASAGLDEYLEPEGVTVIEWADKIPSLQSTLRGPRSTVQSTICLEPGATATRHPSTLTRLRWVNIDVLSETERRITYEDFSA